MFEYKVRCRHKLGWKEFKLYADTDIEEFFNRNSIDYVRNITDTVENRQLQEIDRLNNIINELEKELREGSFDVYFCSTNTQKTFKSNEIIIKSLILDKLKELKENNNGK